LLAQALLSLLLLSCASPGGLPTGEQKAQRLLPPAPAPLAPCGVVPEEGCCHGQVLWYCQGGSIKTISCAKNPLCGWDPVLKFYDCGTTGKAAQGSLFPMACAVYFGDAGAPYLDKGPKDATPQDVSAQDSVDATPQDSSLKDSTPPDSTPPDKSPPDKSLPDSTIPDKGLACGKLSFEGCCDGQTLWYCYKGVAQSIPCKNNPLCGWDSSAQLYDCGTKGSAAPGGLHPLSCTSFFGDAGAPASDAGPQDASTLDSGLPCGQVTKKGCCDGETVWYCNGGVLQSYKCNTNPHCGWYTTSKYYGCGTKGTADPTSTYPKSCAGLLGDTGPAPTDFGPADLSPDVCLAPDLPPPPDQGPLPDVLLTPDLAMDAPALPDTSMAQEGSPFTDGTLDTPAGNGDTQAPPPPPGEGCSCSMTAKVPLPGLAWWWGLIPGALVLLNRRRHDA